jgi:N-acetylglucosaminyldiphosphoundecaprenol N-acetyl-beta-D-mannosaminyltransferase
MSQFLDLPTEPDPARVHVWDLPIAPWTLAQTVDAVDYLVHRRSPPAYFITANLNFAMLCERDPHLVAISQQAAFVTADGMPLLWEARRRGTPLPERVTGSDLVYALTQRAAERGYRLFLMGGPPGVAESAAQRLVARYPDLVIAGTACPPFRPLQADEQRQLIQQIRDARPDLLYVCLSQPKGEYWIYEHFQELGVPVLTQLGASVDFVAGRVSRAPRWMQRTGLEWAYRALLEPRRLGPRYVGNALFLLRRRLKRGR